MSSFLLSMQQGYSVEGDTLLAAMQNLRDYLNNVNNPPAVDPINDPVNPISLVDPTGPKAEWNFVYTTAGDNRRKTLAAKGKMQILSVDGTQDSCYLTSYDRVFRCYKVGTTLDGQNSYLLFLSIADENNGGQLFADTCWVDDSDLDPGTYDKDARTANGSPWTDVPRTLS